MEIFMGHKFFALRIFMFFWIFYLGFGIFIDIDMRAHLGEACQSGIVGAFWRKK